MCMWSTILMTINILHFIFKMCTCTSTKKVATIFPVAGFAKYNNLVNLSRCFHFQDINDNDPVFQQSEYTFYADQFTGIGSLIGKTTATDADSGSNGQFSCSYGTTQNAILNTFYTVGTDCSVFFFSRSGLSYDTTVSFKQKLHISKY